MRKMRAKQRKIIVCGRVVVIVVLLLLSTKQEQRAMQPVEKVANHNNITETQNKNNNNNKLKRKTKQANNQTAHKHKTTIITTTGKCKKSKEKCTNMRPVQCVACNTRKHIHIYMYRYAHIHKTFCPPHSANQRTHTSEEATPNNQTIIQPTEPSCQSATAKAAM